MDIIRVDITNCDKEPIHLIGKIQSHGFFIGVRQKDYAVSYISENIKALINGEVENYLGKHIDLLEEKINKPTVKNLSFAKLIELGCANGFDNINPCKTALGQNWFNLIISQSGKTHLLEFEPTAQQDNFDGQNAIGNSVSKILAEAGLQAMLNKAASEIKKIIQYDRVMVYRFEEDGHGQVIAEEKEEYLQPFLGLYYPASDIPRQARELYKVNLTRIIADVNTNCQAIISSSDAEQNLDLTHSVLRAVSPMHIQYLKNMGVASSFSISLISHGGLWGLIACHHYTPKWIDYKAREAAKLISKILSPALEYRLGEEDSEIFTALNDTVNNIINNVKNDDNIIKALTGNKTNINTICDTCGAALILDNNLTTIGETPGRKEIKQIAEWILEKKNEMVFYTNRFPLLFPDALEYSNVASGLFACVLSKEPGELMLLFKAEKKQTIQWGGDPEKAVAVSQDGSMQLTPRQSFDIWTEIVRHSSGKWSRAEIAAIINLREQVIYQISRKASEIRRLNERLNLANEELETFSYTVSHDLRTPLTAIKSYAEMLLDTNTSLDSNARKVLERINVCSDKMALLIKEILNYSNFGRTELKRSEVNMKNLINDIKTELLESFQNIKIEFIVGNTPEIHADEVMMGQVFTNLLGNAIKYSSRSKKPCVKIEGRVIKNETVYSITDNGVGIDIKYHKQVFELFKRMDNAVDFEGTGVGLAIVKRIIERHEGRIWFESVLHKGTTFYVSFKNYNVE